MQVLLKPDLQDLSFEMCRRISGVSWRRVCSDVDRLIGLCTRTNRSLATKSSSCPISAAIVVSFRMALLGFSARLSVSDVRWLYHCLQNPLPCCFVTPDLTLTSPRSITGLSFQDFRLLLLFFGLICSAWHLCEMVPFRKNHVLLRLNSARVLVFSVAEDEPKFL